MNKPLRDLLIAGATLATLAGTSGCDYAKKGMDYAYEASIQRHPGYRKAMEAYSNMQTTQYKVEDANSEGLDEILLRYGISRDYLSGVRDAVIKHEKLKGSMLRQNQVINIPVSDELKTSS